MTGPWDDPTQIDKVFAEITSTLGPRQCLCPQNRVCGHGQNPCDNVAFAVIKLHIPIICRQVHAQRPDLVDSEGNGRQQLCRKCLRSAYGECRWRLERMKQLAARFPHKFPDGVPYCPCGIRLLEVSDILTIIERIKQDA